jgi:hypothetical protein
MKNITYLVEHSDENFTVKKNIIKSIKIVSHLTI